VNYDQTHWIATRRTRPLPTFYYHGHFMEMLDFVAEHYGHALLLEHDDFIGDFRALPRDAQCLYVRLVNRKGTVFARHRLRYPELGDLHPIMGRLREDRWVGPPAATDFEALLGLSRLAKLKELRHQVMQLPAIKAYYSN